MKLSHTLALALLLTLTGCAQANTQATQPTTQAMPKVTEVAITQPTTQPTTQAVVQPTTQPTVAPVAAPTETPSDAPVTPSVDVPSEVPTTAPIAPTRAYTAPTTTPVAVQPVQTAPTTAPKPVETPKEAVQPTASATATPQPTASQGQPKIDCANLKMGDAWAGVSLYCAQQSKPACPPLVKGKDGVNVIPANAPKECVYAQ